MKKYQITPITPEYIESYNQAVAAVVNEKEYLAFLEPPTLEMSRAFVLNNLQKNLPHFIVIEDNKVIAWCDLHVSELPIYAHVGSLGIGVLADWRGRGIGEALLGATIEKALCQLLSEFVGQTTGVRSHERVLLRGLLSEPVQPTIGSVSKCAALKTL